MPQPQGGVGGYTRFEVTGMIKGFFGVLNFFSWVFLFCKFVHVFFGGGGGGAVGSMI